MFPKILVASFAIAAAIVCGFSAQGQEKKEKRTGSVLGKLVSKKATPNGKNIFAEVLAPGEEKARMYRVNYDPQIKAPLANVLAAVKEAQIGDTVQFDWIDTGEGLAMTTFKVAKKGPGGDKKEEPKKDSK